MRLRAEVVGLDGDFDQIRGSVASLLLLWSTIERSAREEVARVNGGAVPKSAYGIAAVLGAWEDSVAAKRPTISLARSAAGQLNARLPAHLRVRNGICHGLDGVSSAHDGHSARLTWTINGERGSIEWDDLQTSLRWLSRVPRAIWIISRSSSTAIGNRLLDDPQNREWWMAEFGLDLSRQV